MKRFMLILMSFAFLFAASAKSIPTYNDVGKNYKTETKLIYNISVDRPAAVTPNFIFCQRTDMQVTTDVTQMYAFTDVLISPVSFKTYTNNNIYFLLPINNEDNVKSFIYDVGKQKFSNNKIISPSFI
jgi:hypothetical protein